MWLSVHLFYKKKRQGLFRRTFVVTTLDWLSLQIGVTSMGPIECATRTAPGPTATSVFTSLHEYASLISHTIDDTENTLKMTRIPGAANRLFSPYVVVLLILFLIDFILYY